MDAIIFTPAGELAEAIGRGDASAVEVLDAHLVHIDRYNPTLNAVVTMDEQAARLGRR